jgi:hypothetical protein
MANEQKGKPTAPVPILVASGTGGDHAADFYLTMMDWLLRGDVGLHGDLEGDISDWLREALTKPVEFERHNIPKQNEASVQRELMRESFAITADPRNKKELQIGDLLEGTGQENLNQTLEALQRGDLSAADKIKADLGEKLAQGFAKQATPESISALANLAARGRALRAAMLCMAIYRKNPLWLIEQARGGNREAVLTLLKLDKLFLTDTCTAKVIRKAELQNDRIFLGQLARAVTYQSKTNWRIGCRMYMYLLLIWPGLEVPSLIKLWHRLDPEGQQFASIGTFEKFVERCRKEFDQIQAEPPTDK